MLSHIEAAMAAHLAGAKLPYLRTVATYGGEFDDGLPGVVRQLPAVWLVFRGSAGEPKAMSTSRRTWKIPVAWLVMCGTRNLRNEVARQGGAASVGVYQMLTDVARLLAGRDFGLGIEPLAPGAMRAIYNGKTQNNALAIYSQEWRTAYTLALPAGATFAELDTPYPGAGMLPVSSDPDAPGGTDWQADLPPLGAVGIRYHLLPDDGTADAEDLLTLQGDTP